MKTLPLAALAFGSALTALATPLPASAAEFTTTTSGKAIILTGDIEPGDTAKLMALTKRINQKGNRVENLFLNSPGGQIKESVGLGSFIFANKINTVVANDDYCASSCVTVFAAGAGKFVFPSARLGVHGASHKNMKTGSFEASPETTLQVIKFYKTIGIPDSVLTKLATTDPDKITWLDADDYRAWKVEMIRNPKVDATAKLKPLY